MKKRPKPKKKVKPVIKDPVVSVEVEEQDEDICPDCGNDLVFRDGIGHCANCDRTSRHLFGEEDDDNGNRRGHQEPIFDPTEQDS